MKKAEINSRQNIAIIVGIIIAIIRLSLIGVITSHDTGSYSYAWDSLSLGGIVGIFRTPIYPAILKVAYWLFGIENGMFFVVLLQNILFVLSISFFYTLAHHFVKSEKIVLVLSVIYAISPIYGVWHNVIYTESFALSGMTFFVYFTVKYYEERKTADAIILFFITFFLLFLRPINVYLLPILAVCILIGYYRKKNIKFLLVGLGCVAILSSTLFIYMFGYKQKYGIFAPSDVSLINKFVILRQHNLIGLQDAEDTELRATMKRVISETDFESQKFWEKNIVTLFETKKPNLKAISRMIDNAIASNSAQWNKLIIERFKESAVDNLLNKEIDPWGLSNKIYIPLFIIYLIIGVFGAFWTYWTCTNHSIPTGSTLILMLTVSNIIVAVYGGYQDWGRLVAPSVPLFLLSAGIVWEIVQDPQNVTLI